MPRQVSNFFPVVGIGASAGGLDAFKRLLKAIPENSGMAYVLVQHLDPNHESLLPEILQKVTSIPVIEIADDIKVQPNHIYVIPSNKMMVATDGVLLLAPRPAKSNTERNLPIDLFFNSLAEVHQTHAIGVVLSGTASDGTLGLKAIKDQGGITFAQDGASAEYDSMPNSAVQAGVVDFILPPEEIPQKLLEVTSKIMLSDDYLQNIPKQEEDVFKQILSLLRIRKGVDFTYYKQTTIRRRILRRMVVNKDEEPANYLKFLRGNIQEQDLLYQDLLIPVTSFFRDKKVFDNLCENVFPAIVKNKVPGEITRIWVAGCSTGQEVYSFAICFKEFLGDNHERIQIFGTDLSEPAITKARIGIYEKNEVNDVSPHRLKEYFSKTNGGYQVNKSIRDMCVFAHHNFLKDPPFGKMDCISCRNVLIYMEPYLQKKALTTFHYALNPKGFLLLGKSETSAGVPDLFAAEGKNDKLYTRKEALSRFIQVTSHRSEQILSRANEYSKIDSDSYRNRTDFQKTADDILLTKYTPAGVVVNETMDIVHFRGNTANYLEQAPGKPSHNLLLMAKNGLGFELRNILHKAKKDKTKVIKENIPVHVNGSLRNISIEAIPLPNTLEPYYLILFHDNNLNNTDESAIIHKKKTFAKTKKDEKDIRIQMLEQELAQAREDMRSITEDQEASNEELQSANEELLSGSEELQSLNEELETSKEELQSTNEELTVLNHELVGLNEQVTDARNYSESIVATLYQPLVVLDKNLRVKTANKAFYKTFKVNEQETEGVLIYDLGNRQWNIPELRTLLEEILPQKKQISDFEVRHNFLSIGERIILLNALEITREKKDEKLILLSIEDVTERKHAVRKMEESETQFNTLANNIQNLAWMANADGWIFWYNDRWYEYTGTTPEEMKGWGWKSVHDPKQLPAVLERWQHSISTGESFEMTFPLMGTDKLFRPFLTRVIPMKDETGKVMRWVGTNTDISEQKIQLEITEESEKKFRQMAELMPQKIWTSDEEGNKNYFNQTLLDYSGYSFEELKGSGWQKIIHHDDWEKNKNQWEESIRTGKNYEAENRLLRKDGKYLWHLTMAIALKDEDGKIKMWIGTKTEIQEQREHNEELEKAKNNAEQEKQIAEEAVKAKQQFLSNMSHEIRTPMNAIVGFTNVVLKTELNKKQKEYINAIKISGDALIVLINDILDLAKVDAGKMTFEQISFNLFESISGMLHLFETKIKEKNLELITKYDPNIPEFLVGDPMRLRQIILNLLSNAVKFTTEGKITIIVQLLKEDAEKVTIEFTVSDTGIGIPKDQLENIFDNFGQANYETPRLYGGTGLGLAIVKKLVELQGGSITLNSKVGKGSSFSFVLSFEKTHAKTEMETASGVHLIHKGSIEEGKVKNIKVLVVEDMALNQLLIKIVLEDLGFELDIADNGKIAIEKLQNNFYDIILMDLQMPEMNGFEATTYIRNEMNSQIPIIALTADVTTMDIEKCIKFGMNDYISKPIDEKILYNKIIKYIKKPI